MCSQCDSDINPFCMENPPRPVNCTLCGEFDKQTYECAKYHAVEYCITERRYINGENTFPLVIFQFSVKNTSFW